MNCLAMDEHMRAMDRTFADIHLVPDAIATEKHVYTGIPHPVFNCVYGESSIEEEIHFFSDRKIPFIWTVTVGSNPSFCNALRERGFTSVGIIHGLTGTIDVEKIERPTFPGYEFKKVEDVDIHAFTELVGSIMGIDGVAREHFEKANKETIHLGASHWIALKEGQVVSAMTAFIKGDIVSYWNRVTVPQERGKGLNRRLAMEAMMEAVCNHGCKRVMTFVEDSGISCIDRERFGLMDEWSYETFLLKSETEIR